MYIHEFRNVINVLHYLQTGGTVIMSNEVDSGGEESPGVLSDDHDHPPDSPDSNSTDPPDTNKGFPWLKVGYIAVPYDSQVEKCHKQNIPF